MHALIPVGVKGEGYRANLGPDVTTAEDCVGLADVFAITDRPQSVRGGAGHQRR
ncbi:hypothetical protein LAUMK41_05728 [Mycobacterium attenuatum]|nr:hypothetical protein LAUMK41_05728 [Mycobacterium attenuatum]